MKSRYIFLPLTIFLLACNTVMAPFMTPVPVMIEPSPTPLPGAARATPPAYPPVVNSSRAAPLLYGSLAETLNLDFRALETLRGEDAWERLSLANQFNKPAPQGAEWLLVKVEVTNRSNRPLEVGLGDFLVTGSRGIAYFGGGCVPPDPSFDFTLKQGETAAGYIVYLIQADDDNLLLLRNIYAEDEEQVTFLALSPGAAVETSTAPLGTPSPLGKSREQPAPPGAWVSTDDWNLRVETVLRGADAWEALQEAAAWNAPPPEGYAYLLVRLTVQATHADERYRTFMSYPLTCLGSGGEEYESATVSPPYPSVEMRLFPGAMLSGWTVFLLPENETCMLVYRPLFDIYGNGARYLTLP